MIFSLDVLPARKGDCLLLHFGTTKKPGLVLVDGGPAKVYGESLQPRLAAIHRARALDRNKPLPLDLVMVSHIDDDHICGILDLTGELVAAKDDRKPSPVKIARFWHNTFDELLDGGSNDVMAAVTASFGPAALDGAPVTDGLPDDAAKVLASVQQGLRLRADLQKLGIPVNGDFTDALVHSGRSGRRCVLKDGPEFTILGPMGPELEALRKEHATFFKNHKDRKPPTSALAAYLEKTVTNLSSIVLLVEVRGKRMLFTGDARGDKILAGLNAAGLLKKSTPLHVDILKMPHHGSDRNIAPDFFSRIVADHYVFSGNGEHGNPERETLRLLNDARGGDAYTVHLTYPVDEIDALRKLDWNKEQAKEKKKSSATRARKNWSDRNNSLAAFLDAHKAFENKVRSVPRGGSVVIDLHDPLGY